MGWLIFSIILGILLLVLMVFCIWLFCFSKQTQKDMDKRMGIYSTCRMMVTTDLLEEALHDMQWDDLLGASALAYWQLHRPWVTQEDIPDRLLRKKGKVRRRYQ